MPIVFQCEGCGKGYEVSDGLAGKTGRCKACGHSFRIPIPGAAPIDTYGIEDVEPEPAPLPPQTASRSPEPAASGFGLKPAARAKPKVVDAENQAQFRAVGIKLLIGGVLVFLLPFVGLQIKGLHVLGPVGQMIGGVVLLGLGGSCFAVSYTARPMRSMGLAIGGILGVIVLFVVIVGPTASRRRQAALAGAAGPVIDAPAPPGLAPPAPIRIPARGPEPIRDVDQVPEIPPMIPPPALPPGPNRIRQIPRVGARPVPRPAGPATEEPFKVTIRNVKIGPDARFPNVPNRMDVEFDYTVDEGKPPIRPLTLVLDSASTRNGRVSLVRLKPEGGHFAGHVLIPRADKGPFDCYLGTQTVGPGGLAFDAVSNVAKGEWGP